jgi:hypothetical protein
MEAIVSDPKPGFPVVAAIVIATVCLLNPVHDTDLFWQVTFGERIVVSGGPIHTEPFYPDAIGRPIIPIYWLAQVYDALIVRVGGFELLTLLDTVVWAMAFTIPAWQAGRHFGRPCGLAAVVGFFTASAFYMLRPQSFAMLGMGLLLALLLTDWRSLVKITLGIIIMLLWQNSHPSVIVAGVMLLPFVVVGWWRRIDGQPWAESILLLLVPLAMIATPAGTAIFELMRINTDRVALFGVNEWQPIYHESNRRVITRTVIGIVLTLIAIVVLAIRKRLTFDQLPFLLLVLGFAILTMWSHRFVVFFGIVCIPFWVLIRTPLTVSKPTHRAWWVVVLVSLIASMIGLKTNRLPLWNDWFPIPAVEVLKREHLTGPVFVTTEWGGLISYHGMSPLMDGRYFARTRAECEWYFDALRGTVSVDDIEQRHHPVAFFLTPDCPILDASLAKHPGWRLIHRDDTAIVYVRLN